MSCQLSAHLKVVLSATIVAAVVRVVVGITSSIHTPSFVPERISRWSLRCVAPAYMTSRYPKQLERVLSTFVVAEIVRVTVGITSPAPTLKSRLPLISNA